jgi:hypothetical protein
MIGNTGELGPRQLHKFVLRSSKWIALTDGWPVCQQEAPSAERRKNNGVCISMKRWIVDSFISLQFLPSLPLTGRTIYVTFRHGFG